MHMGGSSGLAPFGGHAFISTWSFYAGWVVLGVVLLATYLLATRAAARRGHHRPLAQTASFVGGVLLLELVMASSIDAYAMSLFWVHMVEHLLLIMVVPAFLVLGHPLSVVRDALPETESKVWQLVLARGPVAWLTHPLVGILAYGGIIVGTHLTGFMDSMAMNPWQMPFEQVLYLVGGCWLLLPLLPTEPLRWQVPHLMRIVLLLIAMVPDTVVGIVLMQSERNPFPMYTSMRPSWATAALDDVHIGGALMWVAGDGLMMCFGVGVVIALISHQGSASASFGTWLESVRRQTLVSHVSDTGESITRDVDPDSDEALDAYNRMLGRLNHGPGER